MTRIRVVCRRLEKRRNLPTSTFILALTNILMYLFLLLYNVIKKKIAKKIIKNYLVILDSKIVIFRKIVCLNLS